MSIETLSHEKRKLGSIYLDPVYYSGYYVKGTKCNLNVMGSTPAEQNHSSIVAFNGKSASWNIAQQLEKLLSRQQMLCKRINEENAQLTVNSHRYKSKLDAELASEDNAAKLVLSKFAHNKFHDALVSSQSLQVKLDELDGTTQLIWPSNSIVPNDVCVRIKLGERCNCYNRRAFDGQCKHELRLDPTFKIDHWNERWLQESEYNIKHPSIDIYENIKEQNMLQQCEGNSSTTKNTSRIKESMCVPNNIRTMTEVINIDLSDEEFVENNLLVDDENAAVNYKDLLDVATELCRTVINDQKIAKSTYCLLHEWIKRIRLDKSTQVNFVSVNTDLVTNISHTDADIPIAATVTPQHNKKRDNRFISSLEAQRTYGML